MGRDQRDPRAKRRFRAHSPMAKPLDFAQFHLEKATLEVRFDFSFFHWDRSSAIWTELRRRMPKLKVVSADPAKIEVRVNDRYTYITELEKALITDLKPHASLKGFASVADSFFRAVNEQLEIVQYNRIGTRLIYFRNYPTKEAAVEAFADSGVNRIPGQPLFGVKGALIGSNYLARFEDDVKGYTIQMRTESRKLVLDLQPTNLGWENLKIDAEEKHGIIFDVDKYTVAPVDVDQFDADEWLKQVVHAIRRDSPTFLGG